MVREDGGALCWRSRLGWRVQPAHVCVYVCVCACVCVCARVQMFSEPQGTQGDLFLGPASRAAHVCSPREP